MWMLLDAAFNLFFKIETISIIFFIISHRKTHHSQVTKMTSCLNIVFPNHLSNNCVTLEEVMHRIKKKYFSRGWVSFLYDPNSTFRFLSIWNILFLCSNTWGFFMLLSGEGFLVFVGKNSLTSKKLVILYPHSPCIFLQPKQVISLYFHWEKHWWCYLYLKILEINSFLGKVTQPWILNSLEGLIMWHFRTTGIVQKGMINYFCSGSLLF